MRRLPDDLQQLLTESGLPWRIELGTRHYKVFVGTRFCAILPRGTQRPQRVRAHKNAVAQIRRAIREQRNGL